MTKTRKSDFRPDDFVVYPAHGVGKILSIEEQEVAGFKLELFVIYFEKDKMTLRVPTNKAVESGLRPLATPEVVAHAMKTLRGKARIKKAMWSRRAQEYEQKINSGDLIAIAEVVRDLHRADDQREQSYSERQLYDLWPSAFYADRGQTLDSLRRIQQWHREHPDGLALAQRPRGADEVDRRDVDRQLLGRLRQEVDADARPGPALAVGRSSPRSWPRCPPRRPRAARPYAPRGPFSPPTRRPAVWQ